MATVIPRMYSTVAQLNAASFSIAAMPPRRVPEAILMCEPTYFNVVDTKNPFMDGNIGACDTELAKKQWSDIRSAFEKLGRKVHTLEAQADVEDMVFAANQGLPGERPDGSRFVILSNMVHPSRRREVPFYGAWFEKQGYDLLRISPSQDEGPRFEGQGDAIWHPGRYVLWCGYGQRSERAAYDRIAELTGADLLMLELVQPKFYHLDTAFCPLDAETVMICPQAFTKDGLALIRAVFANVIEIDENEGGLNFAGNALVLGRNVVLQRGSAKTCEALRSAGFSPVEVDTSEFMKSGGSVFCIKIMVY